MADRGDDGSLRAEGLRRQLRERLAALTAELQRLRFETDRRWDELLARLTERPEEIVPEELFRDASAIGRPVPPGSVAADAARRLDSAKTQVEALTRFLDECRRHASRVAILVERRGHLQVWKSAGFEGPGPAPGADLAAPEDAAIAGVRKGLPQRLGRGSALSASLGAADAAEAVLVPFVVREKVSGAVYADVSGVTRLDADAVALLTWIAGLVVDRLARRKLAPSPALRPISDAGGIAPSEAPPSEAPPSFASTPPPERPAAPLPREEGAAIPPPAATPASTGFRRPTGAGRAGESPLGGPLAPPAGEERREEARRFARLLASEIKLYNEQQVAQGRARGDLYARLREDIERGRRLYEERVPAELRSDADYYYEEIVDVLAGGRPEALK